MKVICLLEENEKEWETDNQKAQEIPHSFFLLKSVLKGQSWLFSWSVLGYIALIYEEVLFQLYWLFPLFLTASSKVEHLRASLIPQWVTSILAKCIWIWSLKVPS